MSCSNSTNCLMSILAMSLSISVFFWGVIVTDPSSDTFSDVPKLNSSLSVLMLYILLPNLKTFVPECSFDLNSTDPDWTVMPEKETKSKTKTKTKTGVSLVCCCAPLLLCWMCWMLVFDACV